MKLAFSWKSSHPRLRVRLVIADGHDVMIVDERGALQPFPRQVSNGDALEIAEAFVAYGSDSHWLIRVLVDDTANAPMRGLSIAARYDDTVEEEGEEHLCDDEDVSPNQADDFPKDLAIPPRRVG
jgi:hypothetical protein